MVKLALSEGVNGHLPDRDLDVGQPEFPDQMDEYKSVSCCLLLDPFLATKLGKITTLQMNWFFPSFFKGCQN